MSRILLMSIVVLSSSLGYEKADAKDRPPNILFAIADDWGLHAGAYGTKWIKTPTFDRLAGNGLLFRNAYTPVAKCAPSRAIILTGRHAWQNEEAGNHMAYFPAKLKSWPEVLTENGWHMGITGKGWGPGIAHNSQGKPRQITGKQFNQRKTTPPTGAMSNNDYAANFSDFLDASPNDQPWCFWFGAAEPHREYEFQSGVHKGNKKLEDIERVPKYWPDEPTVRHDMLDYAFEVEYVDEHLGKMVAELERRGMLNNTVIIVTSDHGVPFPRAKGYAYHDSNHIPLAVHWPSGLKVGRRVIDDFVNFTDIAPTILDLAGINESTAAMQPVTGRSWRPIFESHINGQVLADRDFTLVGKERTDVGRPNDWGYPIRGIVTKEFLYLRNYEPTRWPAGNPETGYLDTDGSPTKSLILDLGRKNRSDTFWILNFGMRPMDELYDLRKDPGCVNNLAHDTAFNSQLDALRNRMETVLKSQADPRMFGRGSVFDDYKPTAGAGFYDRQLRGEKPSAGWVSRTDFEPSPIQPNEVPQGAVRPNILWLTSEDHGPHVGCYGDKLAKTPTIDALAAKGMLFKRAWSCAPVCAPARTTIITGLYPPSFGAEHMRSELPMPKGTQMFPQYLRQAGYYCTNNSKEDYNATKPGSVWDESSGRAHWRNRRDGQPFFAVFNSTVSHESQIRKRPHQPVLDPARVRVPAYHPDTQEVRRDWAQYYDKVSEADQVAGERLKELSDAGLDANTIVFYFADHGSGMPRNKRWPCNSGLQVPMVVYLPEKWKALAPREYSAGSQSDRLVSFVDLAPTMLSIAGVVPPTWMQGHAFAGPHQKTPQPFIYGFRGRMDERYDFVRSVTDGRYTYLRNYMPHRSQAQHVGYQFETPTTQVWRRMFDEGKLSEAQSLFWRVPKAVEELYDLHNDPDEVRNLASLMEHQETLIRLRQAHLDLAARIRDTGFLSEAEVHSRSGSESPRDALAKNESYPYEAISTAAGVAANLDSASIPQLGQYLNDRESSVRYWGAMGALIRGSGAVRQLYPALIRSLDDSSHSVRIVAAEAIGKHGKDEDLSLALQTLAQSSDPTKASAYTGVAAMNAIDELGAKASPLLGYIESMPTKDPRAVPRGNEYVARMKTYVLEQLGRPNKDTRK